TSKVLCARPWALSEICASRAPPQLTCSGHVRLKLRCSGASEPGLQTLGIEHSAPPSPSRNHTYRDEWLQGEKQALRHGSPVHASYRCPHRGCIRPRFANRNHCSVII